MSRQIALKYVLPFAAVALLILLAAWAFRLPPVAALTGQDTPAAIERLAPSPEHSYASDTISVSGLGRVVGVPDVASLSLGVSVTSPSVAVARTQAAASMQAVMTALSEQGIADADIQTTHFSIYPEWDWIDGEQVLQGYEVTNQISVKVQDATTVAAVIDAAVAAGGDDIRFNGLSFDFSDTVRANMERQARKLAVQDMRNKAVQLAQFGGRNIGLLREISETDYGVGAVAEGLERGFAAAMALDADTSISPGESEVSVFVTGVYDLR